MRQAAISFSVSFLLLFSGYLVFQSLRSIPAQSATTNSPACCGPQHPVLPRELDFPYYSLENGWTSTLNLVSASPRSLDFSLTVHSRTGQTVTVPKMTIRPQEKLPIEMAALLRGVNADSTGDFSEGSVALNFVGTVMPLVGQMTVTNPALGLIHEAEMVENDPGRTDIPAELDGLWWNISGGRDARIMVTNTSAYPASADVYLDFGGERHPSAYLKFRPHENKVLSITHLLNDLDASPATAPEGGISIIQRELKPTLIAQGKVLDPVTGFSTTLNFPNPAFQGASALHASGVPVGKPTPDSPFSRTGTFVPHVIVRNLLGAAQSVTITVEYPNGASWGSAGSFRSADLQVGTSGKDQTADLKGGSTTGQIVLPPMTIGPYSTEDISLSAVMNQLPLPLPFCSIRIQYSGRPGSAIAEVSSVELKSDMVIDAPVANEGNGWAGSGANPWHLDNETDSILFLTDESDQPARIGFQVQANGVHYYIGDLELGPHETRAIDMRELRDAQKADFKRNVIPPGATDGSVSWIRVDNVAVSGRLMVLRRHKGMATSYDCYTGPCPGYLDGDPSISPGSIAIAVGAHQGVSCLASYIDDNGLSYPNITVNVTWSSDNPSVMSVSSSTVTGVAGGWANLTAQTNTLCSQYGGDGIPGCNCILPIHYSDSTPVTVVTATLTANLGPPPSSRSSSLSNGDSLSFTLAQTSCGLKTIGAQGCVEGWVWQMEVAGSVNDDGSKWTVSQTLNNSSVTTYFSDGTNQTSSITTPQSDNPNSAFVQQTAGTKSIFWLDAPGKPNSDSITSVSFDAAFTSRVCSTITPANCECVDWHTHLIGNKNTNGIPVVDSVNSNASITKYSYKCSP